MDAYKLSESEKESAVNGYLMSLAVFATTTPIPIINLIANIIYYIRRRKSTYLTRWHSMNAFVSQLPLFFMNSFTWYSVWQLVWDEWQLNNTSSPIMSWRSSSMWRKSFCPSSAVLRLRRTRR